MRPSKATVARSGAWAAATVIGSEAIFLAVFVAVSRILGPHDIGVVALAGIFAEILSLIALLGVPQALIQATRFSELKADTAFWLVQAGGALCSTLAFVAAAPVARWFGVAEIENTLEVLALLPWLVALGAVHEARLMREFRFRSLTGRALTANGLAGTVALGMALNGFGLWSLVAQRLVLSAMFSVWSWSACKWLPGVRLSVTEARGLVAFGKNVLIGEVARPLHLRLFDVLLGHALGPSAVGWFRLAMRCFEFLVKALSLPLVRVSLPALSRLVDAPVALRETLSRQLKLGALVALPAFCGAAVLADDLLVAVFGTRWQPSVAVFQVLCVAGLPLVFERLGWVALTAVGKPEWVARANLLLLAVMAVIAWLCAPYGPVVVAGAFVLRSVFVVPTIAWLLCKVRALEPGAWLGQIGRVFVAALLVTALAVAQQSLLISSFGLTGGVLAIVLSSLLVYVVLIKALAPAQFREAIEIWRLIRRGQALRT